MTMDVMDDIPTSVKPHSKRFLDQYRVWLRLNGYAYATEKTYISWVIKFIRFHNRRHPKEMGAKEVSAFLSFHALNKNWSPSTQKTALNALINLYVKFLHMKIEKVSYAYAKVKKRLPVVMSHEEACSVIHSMKGDQQLMAKLMYGTGLRISECISLRVKDIDFAMNQLVVRSGKGDRDRFTLLPASLCDQLKVRIEATEKIHQSDLLLGFGSVYLPFALAAKYPKAEFEFIWQYIFPSIKISKDPRSGAERRHHIHHSQLQRAIKRAAVQAGIHKRITSHCFRHSFATKLALDGVHLTQIQKYMGHSSLETTEIYLHIAEQMGMQVRSPIDQF